MSHERIIPRWIQVLFAVTLAAMVLLSILAPLAYVVLSQKINAKAEAACADANDIRINLLRQVEESDKRSLRSYNTVMNDPESTEDQRATAQKNRDEFVAGKARFDAAFAVNECG